MFILMPTSNAYVRAAEISGAMLRTHWPDHPPLQVVHHEKRPAIDGAIFHYAGPQAKVSWTQAVRETLRQIDGETFILLFDDYAVCGDAKTDLIDTLHRRLLADHAAGMAALCWLPAHHRDPAGDGLVKLTAPVMMQLAIWRRDWFLAIADTIDASANPWDFQLWFGETARTMPRTIYAADIPMSGTSGPGFIDGMDNKLAWPLPYHNLKHAGEWAPSHAEFLRPFGITFRPTLDIPLPGDVIENLAKRIGADRLAKLWERWTGKPCGCEERKAKINAATRRLMRWVGAIGAGRNAVGRPGD